MTSLREKKELIREGERKFAYALAAVVLDKPKVSLWMILIPIIIVFFMYKYQKYVADRDAFAENFLIERNRALDETADALASNKPLKAASAIANPTLPDNARKEYTAWMQVLMDHYATLLSCDGESYEALVKFGYKNKTHYQTFLNQLTAAEKRFNAALKPHIQQSADKIDEVVKRMEICSEELRHEHMVRIFQ